MITKYDLSYRLITEMLDYVIKDPDSIDNLTNRNYFEILITQRGGSTFYLGDLNIEVMPLNHGKSGLILYTFPTPDNESEAIFGAVVINQQNGNIAMSYFTLETSSSFDSCYVCQVSTSSRSAFGKTPRLNKQEFVDYIRINLDK